MSKKRASRGSLDISETRVHEAADLLVSEGSDPTIDQVREKLGGGSYTDIGPHLKSWKSQRRPTLTAIDVELPEELTRLVKESAAVMWNKSNSLAGEKIKAVDEAAASRVREAQTDRAALEKEISSLEADLDERDEKLEVVTLERDNLLRELQELRVAQAELVSESQGQKQQLTDYKDRIQMLEETNAEAAADYKGRIAKLEAELEDHRARIVAADQLSLKYSSELSMVNKELSGKEAKIKAFEMSLEAIRAELLASQKSQAKQEGIAHEQAKRIEEYAHQVAASSALAERHEKLLLEAGELRGRLKKT